MDGIEATRRIGQAGLSARVLVASEPRTSVLVVAPTQSGKTTSLVIPTILEWDGPVLATSIKAALVQDTLAGDAYAEFASRQPPRCRAPGSHQLRRGDLHGRLRIASGPDGARGQQR